MILFSGDTLNQSLAPSKILSMRGNKVTSVNKIWTRGSEWRMYFGYFCGRRFDFSFLCRAVRKAGENMLCMKLL